MTRKSESIKFKSIKNKVDKIVNVKENIYA